MLVKGALAGGAGVLASPFAAVHGLGSPLTSAYANSTVPGLGGTQPATHLFILISLRFSLGCLSNALLFYTFPLNSKTKWYFSPPPPPGHPLPFKNSRRSYSCSISIHPGACSHTNILPYPENYYIFQGIVLIITRGGVMGGDRGEEEIYFRSINKF